MKPAFALLFFFVGILALGAAGPSNHKRFRSISCEGSYRHHLQGICTNGKNALYWCFTTTLVKTDVAGSVLKKVPVGNHHGDLCHHAGKVYVAVNFGNFNDPLGNADSWVYVYDALDLTLLAKHPTPEVFHGAGGIAYGAGKFIVVGGLPDGVRENYLYEYDGEFNFVKRHVLKSGTTRLGIQTAAFSGGQWWFGCYGDPKILLKTGKGFRVVERFEFDCSLGIVGGGGGFLVARGQCSQEKGCTGKLLLAEEDTEKGLAIQPEPL